MSGLVWPFVILMIAILIISIEVFVPSAGVLTFLAAATVVASISTAFYYAGLMRGTMFLAFTCVLVPFYVALMIKVWPQTPMGRRILIQPPDEDEILPKRDLDHLVGRYGTAKSPMLPSGAIVIDGRTYDAVTQGVSIDRGESIAVVAVQGNRVIVRSADPAEAEAAARDDKIEDNVLAQPVDSMIPDPFDDSLS